jgi:hypothetical protein
MFGPKEFDMKMKMLLLIAILLLGACAGPQNVGMANAGEPAKKEASAADTKNINAKPGVVDYSCKTDNDCAIKDVGSCCGASPACVNKDSATYPEQVQAQCKNEGMSSICGFASISSCTCKDSKCQGVAGPMSEGESAVQ